MTKLEVIGIPLKKASDVEILKPLKNLITSRYQTHEQEGYINAINDFAKLRNNAVVKSLDFHENSLDIIYRYYDQICALEYKIPASEFQIPFKWKDAFDKGSIFGGRISLTLSSLSYEKVCVLFNIAALQSQVASVQSFDSDEALKLAAKLFQSSAGIFNHLRTIVVGSLQQDPTPDLQPDTLLALSSLMLAQAQEVIAFKARAGRMKDMIVAKLYSQCDDLYADAVKNMQKELLKPLWEREWLPQVASKQLYCKGVTMYHQSRVCNESRQVGEEIARLKLSLENFKIAQTRSGDSSSFTEDIGRSQRCHDEAVKDNDFIYHERVPDPKLLTPVVPAVVAKLTPLQQEFSTSFTDLFSTLVPVAVQQALTQCETRKDSVASAEIMKMKQATEFLNSVLNAMNLPAAIEDTSGDKLPQSLKDKANAVCEKGGVKHLDKLLEELPMLFKRNEELLDEIDRMLNEEKTSDDQLRLQFKQQWTRTASDKLTANFRANSEKYRKVIETAVEADGTIRQKYADHRRGIALLSDGIGAIAAAVPSAEGTPQQESSARTQLQGLMEQVETLKCEREVIMGELKSATLDMRETFLRALDDENGLNETALSTEALGRVFGPLQKQVHENLTNQERILAEITTAHENFCSGQTGAEGERERLLKELAAAHDKYIELFDNLNEGTKFYNDLTHLLVNLQSKVSDYIFARRTEKEELLKDLTSGLSRVPTQPPPQAPAHHDTAKSAPPVRPPPPQTSPQNPYQGAPQAPQNPYQGAPQAPGPQNPQHPYQGAPGALPYPVNPQGMPAPPGGYNYPVYTPMPQGYSPYNPYYTQGAQIQGVPQGQVPQGGVPQGVPYPTQQYGYPYPQQPQGGQWPPRN